MVINIHHIGNVPEISPANRSRSVVHRFLQMLLLVGNPSLIPSLIKDLRLYLHFFPLENQMHVMILISVIFPVVTVSVLLNLFYFRVDWGALGGSVSVPR